MLSRYKANATSGHVYHTAAKDEAAARDVFKLCAAQDGVAVESVEVLPQTARESTRESILLVNAPDWFLRDDFADFVRGKRPNQCQPPATWHPAHAVAMGEYSDVFVTYDSGEGSDYGDIPDDIWAEICEIASREGLQYGFIRITNIEDFT